MNQSKTQKLFYLYANRKIKVGHDGYIELNAILDDDYRMKRGQEIFATIFFLGVKSHRYVNRAKWKNIPPMLRFKAMEEDLTMVEGFTPRQIMTIFPIDKVYDKTGEVKDYFSTMDMIKQHGLDTPIHDVFEFLINYMNKDIRIFCVDMITALSDLKREQGGTGVLEDLLVQGDGYQNGEK
ncbi:hypothetical protein [Lactiplantibacillus daowaiensis]|uniref:Uncharacterized protein n=1 Tax=Lactiplantibacillus daowaiensis TaxID=2559918 RepID=A0ABW1RWU7_9LACO|nr:hypothetical protein [Lactiplantibacillus daowaiensis]